MQKEQKRLIYKCARGTGDKTLQSALVKALKKYSKPGDRLEPLGTDGAEVRFVAYGRSNQQMLIGVFHKLTQGRAQEVIEMAKGKEEWPVSLVTAKGPGKESREFVEGTLFFGVWKNHVVVHQSASCRADSLQEYLSWLLSREGAEKANGTVAEATLIELTDPIPPGARKKSKMPVKKLTFGGAVQTRVVGPDQKASASVSRAKMFFEPTGRIWKALLEILRELNAKVPDNLALDGALGEDDLRVYLELSCTKKKAESTAGEVLGALGRSLSHADGAEYTVELADGSTISGDTMKVGKHFGVECVDRHPVHESIFRCMIDYMTMLVQDETIVEDEPFGNAK